MKRHVQEFGVKPWAGQDLLDLQAEPFKVLDSFFQEYGPCIIKGCEVTPASNLFNVAPGLVALAGTDNENTATFKVVPFTGAEAVTLPLYLTLTHTVVTRPYADKKVRPIAYDYKATASIVQPTDTPFFEITATGGSRFVDAIKVTGKLDKTGNGRDITVTFAEAAERVDITSGEKLSSLFGKIAKWLASLKTVAFTGKAADLEQDTTHRLVSDTEKAAWADKYTKANTYTRTEIEQKIAAIVDSAPGTLDTLKELAAALGNDPNFATSIMALIGGKADTVHAHTIANIAGLQNELDGKMRVSTLDNVDLNTVIISGSYRLIEAHANLPNPSCAYGNMLVMRGADTITQIVTDYRSSKIYWRSGNPPEIWGKGSWCPWREIWHAGNLNPADMLNCNVYQPLNINEARNCSGYTTGNTQPDQWTGPFISFGTTESQIQIRALYNSGTIYSRVLNPVTHEWTPITQMIDYDYLHDQLGGFQPKQPFVMSVRNPNGYYGIYIPTAKPGDHVEFWSSDANWYGLKCGNLNVFGTAKVNDKQVATTDQFAGTMKIIIAGHVLANSKKAGDCVGRDFGVAQNGNTYTITHMLNIANYHVMATGGNSDVGQAYAALVGKNANSFTIRTADDTTGLEAEFYFTMYEIV